MSEELKPCPFCGNAFPAVGYDSDMRALERDNCITARCRQCGAETRKFPKAAEAITAWNTRTEAIEAGAVKGLVDAAEKLSNAECGYRLCHDVKGDGHIETGRAWDYMRRCGDALRAALSQLAEASK